MPIAENLNTIKKSLPSHVTLVAVTKTHASEKLMELYDAGHKIFGENKVQEMCDKYEQLPKDIKWHMIGHLQSNKVKQIAPFVSMIHSVDSIKLLEEINKQAFKNNRIIECLLQIHIAEEETKFGLSFEEADLLIHANEVKLMHNVKISGLMGMATNTSIVEQVRTEFRSLQQFMEKHPSFTILSMGMSSDYPIAIEEGSTMVRVGSSIFGGRSD